MGPHRDRLRTRVLRAALSATWVEAFIVSETVALVATFVFGLRDPWLFLLCAIIGVVALTDIIFDPSQP